jgi:hypothetical protein
MKMHIDKIGDRIRDHSARLVGATLTMVISIAIACMVPAVQAATPHALNPEQAAQLKGAFADLVQTIGKGHPAPWVHGCQIIVNARPGNEEFRDKIIAIAKQAGCGASIAKAKPSPSDVDPTVIEIFSTASMYDLTVQAANTETDHLVYALRKPPLSLDAQRSDKMPPEGIIYIDLGNVSPWPSK